MTAAEDTKLRAWRLCEEARSARSLAHVSRAQSRMLAEATAVTKAGSLPPSTGWPVSSRITPGSCGP